jgi:hypothetical protein
VLNASNAAAATTEKMQNAIINDDSHLDMAGHPNTQLTIAMHPDNNPANKRNLSVRFIARSRFTDALIDVGKSAVNLLSAQVPLQKGDEELPEEPTQPCNRFENRNYDGPRREMGTEN